MGRSETMSVAAEMPRNGTASDSGFTFVVHFTIEDLRGFSHEQIHALFPSGVVIPSPPVEGAAAVTQEFAPRIAELDEANKGRLEGELRIWLGNFLRAV
jgi:hypothetical protein